MLCFSGGGMLNIKASNFPVHQQKLQVCHTMYTTVTVILFNFSVCNCKFMYKRQLYEDWIMLCT